MRDPVSVADKEVLLMRQPGYYWFAYPTGKSVIVEVEYREQWGKNVVWKMGSGVWDWEEDMVGAWGKRITEGTTINVRTLEGE